MTTRRFHDGFLPLLALSAGLLSASPTGADPSGQFYLTAVMAPRESIVGTSGQPNAVYLRWDTIEGDLPAGLQRFTLERDTGGGAVEIADLPVQVPAAVDIAALYAGADQDRRRLEITSWLDREDPAVLPYEEKIRNKLLGDPVQESLWLGFGSRLDFNIARARQRGYRDDDDHGGATVQYELIGHVDDGMGGTNAIRLGLLSVDTSQTHVVPAATDFAQVTLGRCDAPEEGKDQQAVALGWSIPEQKVDQYRNALVVAGWDVWRRDDCATVDYGSAAPVDLRTELGTSGSFDADGNPVLPGYERVNDQPVVVSGGSPSEQETRYKGENPDYAQLYETTEQVAAAGLEPGRSCPYYVVPRDVTGNYGETQELLVTIPDPLRPPAPWVIETVSDNVSGELDVAFDHVNVENYFEDHQRGRTYCNLDTARFDKELVWVEAGQSCDTATRHRVKLDVVGYNVYRFRHPEDARNFTDSDGDGYGDGDERQPHPLAGSDPAYETITYEGSACDPDVGVGTYWRTDPAADGLDYTLTAVDVLTQRADGRLSVEFSDVEPASFPEDVYWYRVASVHADGRVSKLSEPVRGLYHDVTRPARDDTCGVGDLVCTPQLTVLTDFRGFPFAEDVTTERIARHVTVSCNGQVRVMPLSDVEDPAAPGTFVYGYDMPTDVCEDLAAMCQGATPVVGFLDGQGSLLATDFMPSYTFDQCATEGATRVQLDADCSTRTVDRFTAPQTARSALGLDCPQLADTCYRIFREVDGHDYPVATICDDDQPVCFEGFLVSAGGGQFQLAECPPGFTTEIQLPNIGGEPVCLSFGLVNENNLSSTKQRLPCFETASPPPGPPQLVEFAFTPGTNAGAVVWVPPEQPALGTLVEYYRDGGSDADVFRKTVFFPHPEVTAIDGALSQAVVLDDPVNPGSPDWEEDWCFRARTIGRAPPGEEEEALSGWAGPRCDVRTAPGFELPEYLGWPQIPAPPEGASLNAMYLPADGLTAIWLAPAFSTCISFNDCPDIDQNACFPNLGQEVSVTVECPGFCNELESAFQGQGGFVAYRQERDGLGVAGEFYQVSAFVPGVHCVEDGTTQSLADPLIQWISMFNEPAPWNQQSLMFLDRYPNVVGTQYRYQLVYFDVRGEITGYRTSNWVTAVAGP